MNKAFDIFLTLQGTYGFEVQIDRYMELAKYFHKVLKKKDNFKLVFDAEVRNLLVCFFGDILMYLFFLC